jgi:hypothetical protein
MPLRYRHNRHTRRDRSRVGHPIQNGVAQNIKVYQRYGFAWGICQMPCLGFRDRQTYCFEFDSQKRDRSAVCDLIVPEDMIWARATQ